MLKHTTSNFPVLRKRVKMTVTSGAESKAGDIIRFKIPSQSLVDLKTMNIVCDLEILKNDGVAPSLGEVQGSYSLIRRFGATIAGVGCGYENNEWNQVAHQEQLTSIGLEQNAGNLGASEYPGDGRRLKNGDMISFNYFPNSIVSMGVLDTSVYGECEIDILLDSEDCLYFPNGSADTQANLTLKNIRCYVDVLQLQDDTYAKAVASHLSSGGVYRKAVDLATVVNQVNNESNSFNVSTMSLNDVCVGVKPATYKTRAVAGVDAPYSNYLNFDMGETNKADAQGKSIYVEINSQAIPQYGFSNNFLELADITRNNYAGSVYNYNKLFLIGEATNSSPPIYDQRGFLGNNAVVKFQCGGEGPATSNHGKFTGVDLKGNSIIRVNSTGLSNTAQFIMVGHHSSLIEAEAGQVVSFSK